MTSLAALISSTPVGAVPDHAERLRAIARDPAFDRRIGRSWTEELIRWVSTGAVDEAVHSIAVGFLALPDDALAKIRRHGVFRLSKYAFDTDALFEVCKRLRELSDAVGFSPAIREYLAVIGRVHIVGASVAERRAALRDRLTAAGGAVFDGLVRTVELQFLTPLLYPVAALGTRSYPTAENYAEGLSELWAIAGAAKITPQIGEQLPDTVGVLTGEYEDLLRQAIPLRSYADWERLVDLLDYDFVEEKPRKRYRIRARNPDVEKAVRFGFMQSAFQQGLIAARAPTIEEAATIEDVVRRLDEVLRDRGYTLVQHRMNTLERIRLQLPHIPVFYDLLRPPELFAEEIPMFRVATEAYDRDPLELQNLPIAKGLVLWDVLLVQRLMNILFIALSRRFRPLLRTRPGVVVNSLLPSFSAAQFREIIAGLVGEEKASAVLDLLTWDGSQPFCDLQYQPLLRTAPGYAVPMAIIVASNMVRNTMQHARARVTHGTQDPGDSMLAQAIRRSGGQATPNLKYRFAGKDWETDVVGRIGPLLLVFEAKRTLEPTNVKELEGTVREAQDAAAQLDRFLEHWDQPDGRAAIARSLGWDIADVTDVATAVVLPNRMLSAWRIGAHPVRALRELASFLVLGQIAIGGVPGEDDVLISHWRGDTITAADVLAYLRDDLVHRATFDAMSRHERTISVAPLVVVQESYSLRADRLHAALRSIGRVVGTPTLP